jgi:predicted ATPase
VLVFEDIHWAEPTMLDLIDDLADGVRMSRSSCSASPGPSYSTSGPPGEAAS